MMNPMMGTRREKKIWVWLPILFVTILSFLSLVSDLSAQGKYPTRPINFVIGFPAGGTGDTGARPIVAAASKILGQPIAVLNKPGGGSAVAMAGLKNEIPDGYNIGLLVTSAVVSQHMRKVPYDTMKDFTLIMQFGVYSYGLAVRADSPWKTYRELIDYVKANPGKVRYSSAGLGSPQHLVPEMIGLAEKMKWTHIPFEGGPQGVAALLGGHVEVNSETPVWKKHVEAGRLRLLAVYGEKRLNDFPDVPTLLELGYSITAPSIICVVGPKGLPSDVVESLHGAFKDGMADPEFIKISRQIDQYLVYRNPNELAAYLGKMNEEVGTLIRSLGLRKE